MNTYLLAAWLIAAVLSVVIQACDGGNGGALRRSTPTNTACANAIQVFETQPNDDTAMIVRQSCHME